METKFEILLKDGNFIRRTIQDQNLGSQDALLSRVVGQVPVMLPNIFSIGDIVLHLLISQNTIVVVCKLSALPFDTFWRPSPAGGGFLEPCFYDMAGAIRLNDPWIPPPEIGQLLFCTVFMRTGNVTGNCYLFAYRDNELWALPYPNCYGDGRICMGRDWDGNRNVGITLSENFLHAYNSFFSTTANGDLTNERTFQLFQRNIHGWVLPSNSRNFLRTTSVSFMQGFHL